MLLCSGNPSSISETQSRPPERFSTMLVYHHPVSSPNPRSSKMATLYSWAWTIRAAPKVSITIWPICNEGTKLHYWILLIHPVLRAYNKKSKKMGMSVHLPKWIRYTVCGITRSDVIWMQERVACTTWEYPGGACLHIKCAHILSKSKTQEPHHYEHGA